MPCTHCQEEKTIAKGLCRACYYRLKKTGSLEYQRWGKTTTCTVDGCDSRAVAKGLCDKHRIRLKNHGSVDVVKRPDDWGQRTSHPLYKLWDSMRRRCRDPHHKDFDRYGARGVTVCDRWQDFWAFIDDMGPRPSARHSLDRIDNEGPYEPGNCRWATATQQGRNRRSTILTEKLAAEIKRRVAFGDKTGDIARALNLEYDLVRNVVVGQAWRD